MSLAFADILRDARIARPSVLRIALRRGEVLRLPALRHLRVLSGTAWISLAGTDHVVGPGRCFGLGRAHDFAVVSPAGDDALLFEVR
jgi:hypothetical protein